MFASLSNLIVPVDPSDPPMELPPGLDLYGMTDEEVFDAMSVPDPPVQPK